MPALIRRIIARGRRYLWQLRRNALQFRAPVRTALAIRNDRLPPPAGSFARFGTGSSVAAPADIHDAALIEVGERVVIDEMSTVRVDANARLVIGDDCRLGPALVIDCACSIELGDAVTAASSAAVTDRVGWDKAAPVIIEAGVHLGCGSIVGPGVRVGRDAIVADGAVVVDDVPAGAFVVGNPAAPASR